MTNPVNRNIIDFDPRKQAAGGRHQIGTPAGFRLAQVAGSHGDVRVKSQIQWRIGKTPEAVSVSEV